MLRLFLACCLLGVTATSGLGFDYLPLQDGTEWNFGPECGARIFEPTEINGVETLPLYFYYTPFQGRIYFIQDDGQSVTIDEITQYWGEFIGGSWRLYTAQMELSTPIPFFERPLVAGSYTEGVVESIYGFHVIKTTVHEEQNLETPYGQLLVFPIEIVDIPSGRFNAIFYLNKDLGPAGYNDLRLEGIEGLVSVESGSWDKIKSVYR